MNRLVFTSWQRVNIITSEGKSDVSERSFFSEMNKYIKTDNYNVFYDPKTTSFTITYRGSNYEVVLPADVLKSIRIKKYKNKYLATELFKLANITKRNKDYLSAKKEYEERIREIEDSGYSELVDTLDYEMYLTYLNEKSKVSKSEEEKRLIDAKIKGLLKVLTNPHNLRLHIDKFICDVAGKSEELDEEHNIKLEAMLHEIADDFYQEIMSKSNQMLVLGSSDKPMSIIRRIVEVESIVEKWIKEKDIKAKKLKEIPKSVVNSYSDDADDELDEMSEQLHQIMRGGK